MLPSWCLARRRLVATLVALLLGAQCASAKLVEERLFSVSQLAKPLPAKPWGMHALPLPCSTEHCRLHTLLFPGKQDIKKAREASVAIFYKNGEEKSRTEISELMKLAKV